MSDALWEHVWIARSDMAMYAARSSKEARYYGAHVRAAPMSNKDYKLRFQEFSATSEMQDPPSSHRIFDGYVVVRKLGTADEYETWMPDGLFEDLYKPST